MASQLPPRLPIVPWELSRLADLVKFSLLSALAGCAAPAAADCSWFASSVASVSYGSGQSVGRDRMPGVVLGPPQGAGAGEGSLDVVSLGNGGSIVLAFDRPIVDGPGTDFVVFENPFFIGGTDRLFAELATVSVSDDGAHWHDYPCTVEPDRAPGKPAYGRCAGWHPVYQHGGEGPVDPATAGGDPFDLADAGLPAARFVRITDRPDLASAYDGVFDLDAVGIVHGGECL